MLLFCLPHAGATGLSYYRWKPLLNSRIEFVPVDLPGHDMGGELQTIDNFDTAIKYLYEQITDILRNKKEDYAIFGHSLGALFTYELYYRLVNNGQRLPSRLYLSGRTPPSVCKDALCKKLLRMEDAYIYLVNNSLGSGDYEMDASLIEFYSNLLLADIRLMRSYKSIEYSSPILTNTTILFGKSDVSTPFHEIKQWGKLCKGNVSYAQFAGGHLFPLEHAAEVVNLINANIEQ